jgi:OOP family OmpA-OmpF porin
MDWKGIHIVRLIVVLVILSIGDVTNAQNLISNQSFEEHDDCPNSSGEIENAIGWFDVGSSCDYYHECGSNGFGVPVNRGGGGYARTGEAYGQITAFGTQVSGFREFVGIELVETLAEGVVYRVEFYLSLADSVNYAVRNVGVHFSQDPHSQNLNVLLSLNPQISYTGLEFLTDKAGWMQIEGSFIAEGGERYIAIGNFDYDTNTDTISVPDGGSYAVQPEGYWDVSGYFIDDVSVIPDSTYLGTEDIEQEELFSLYPNPAKENVTVETKNGHNMHIELYDAIGGLVLKQNMRSSRENIGVGHLPLGMYVIKLLNKGTVVERQRLMLQ